MHSEPNFVFIVGSPRSGTTLLGQILDTHPVVSQWYEPYFVWDRYFRNYHHDVRTEEEATSEVRKQIKTEFLRYGRKTGSRIVVDKSPRNSLKIPFISAVFPRAKFIHIIRDGRDATLSIHKQWLTRREMAQKTERMSAKRVFELLTFVNSGLLGKQKFVKDKIRALKFETAFHFFNSSKHLNRMRWNGAIGWGPQFKDWEAFYQGTSLIEFNAHQWSHCIRHIHDAWDRVPADNSTVIHYERLLQEPKQTLQHLGRFLEIELQEDFYAALPVLNRDNFDKWKVEFADTDIQKVKPILDPNLAELGYLESSPW